MESHMEKKIVLVHGLGGTVDGTWGNFPSFLDEDLEHIIVSYGYQSPHVLKQFYKRAPSILNIANGLLTELQARCDLNNDEIILVGHSLGGIVIKKLLIKMKEKKINHKIRKVCFFDVPHDGAGLANIGRYISFRNRHLKDLCRDSSQLDDLNDQWIDSELDNVFDIISIVAANDNIVSSSSSKSIFRHRQVETINDVDHSTIVKPENKDSPSYIVFKKFILEKNSVNRYKNIASRNLENWKSLERNHVYDYVSDEKRSNNLESLVSALELNPVVIRLTGASGLGKTRLLLKAIESSSAIDKSCMLVFNAPDYDVQIRESIRAMVEDKAYGLVVIENCSVDLHNHLAREITNTKCLLKLITIGYSDAQVDESIHIQLYPLSDEAIKKILFPILIGLSSTDVDRVARFAQGYPLMATLIAEQYQKEGQLLGSIETDSIVRKLIDGDDGITDAEKEVLSACSLFDVFGTGEGAAGEEAKFIAEDVAGSNLIIFDKALTSFSGRQIINRAGRFARLVPKPLALTLASKWWDEASYERQKKLIESIPDSLMHSFCTQASYLDNQPSVQKFSDQLFGGQSPFILAGELLTDRGSKLFCALVEVNTTSTSNAIYLILSEFSHEQLNAISGDIRRNLVCGLEKLCFHADAFEKSAWCLLLLASAENESWSNNATGMFSQLFRVNLSGTQAKPSIRFDLLMRAIESDQLEIDKVVLEALDEAISTYGSTRTVGAEYQGTRPPLKEWNAELWQDVFNFWQQAFDLMLILFERGEYQKEKVLSSIGHSIRGFVSRERIEMLDVAIRKIVSINGCYWPSALEGIKNAFEYESKGMSQEIEATLNSWLDILSHENAALPEKLKILVINPPWEHRKGDDGHYIDLAAENAKALAIEISPEVEELMPHLSLLLKGEQKQSYAFGCQLANELIDAKPLLDLAFEKLVAIEKPNPTFIMGLYKGIFDQSPKLWQKNIDRVIADKRLVYLYPRLLCAGDIQPIHLQTLMQLIRNKILASDSANELSYGSVIKNVHSSVITDFCLDLTELDGPAKLSALNLISMYCFSNRDCINKISEKIKIIVLSVPLCKGQEGASFNLYSWHNMAEKVLKEKDNDFAVALTQQLIINCKDGFDYGAIWDYIKPLLLKLMVDYSDALWPIFGDAIMQSKGVERYWLKQLLDRETGSVGNIPSVLSVVPVDIIIEWCSVHYDAGPIFVSECINIFETVDDKYQPSALFVALLENFGDDQRVVRKLSSNIDSRGWSGSLVPYLKSDKAALTPLLKHSDRKVRRWVSDYISYIDNRIIVVSTQDEENDIRHD